jgi:hypothetical protein
MWLHVTPTFKIVHRRGADRAENYLAVIELRELNNHPIEVVALHLPSQLTATAGLHICYAACSISSQPV